MNVVPVAIGAAALTNGTLAPSLFPRTCHAAFRGQPGVDFAARVDARAVGMAALQVGEHRSFRIAYADLRELVGVFLLGNVEIAVLAAGDVVRPASAV
jgi:hypothetical protein